jgi:hypothetical protein
MSCELSKTLSFLLEKKYGGMSDSEAKAWAEKEAAEEDLRRERAKVKWLCRQLAFRDAGEPFPQCRRSAEAWESLADLYAEEK